MSGLSRDLILGADDRRTESVYVPEWGGDVTVRGLSGAERDAYEAGIASPRPDGRQHINVRNLRARLVVLACIDPETGDRLFRDDDADALGAKSATAVDRLFAVARRLSGLSDDDIEEMAEGFGDAPNEDSTSG